MGEYTNFLYNFTYVPFYDTLGPDSISFILEQTNLETMIIAESSLKSIFACQKKNKLKNLILIDKLSEENNKKL